MGRNPQNLKPQAHKLTVKEQSEGGKKSAEVRRQKKQLKECLEILLAKEVSKDSDGQSISGAEGMAIRAFKSALEGDWKAWELVRDTAGQKPVDKVEVTNIDAETFSEVEEMIENAKAGSN